MEGEEEEREEMGERKKRRAKTAKGTRQISPKSRSEVRLEWLQENLFINSSITKKTTVRRGDSGHVGQIGTKFHSLD